MYRPPYHPELMNSGGYPGYMYPNPYQHPSPYLAPPPPPPPPSIPPPSMDGYPGPPPQTNNIWDGSGGTSAPAINSPGRNWSGHHPVCCFFLHVPRVVFLSTHEIVVCNEL